MKTEAELNAELIERYKQLSPEKKEMLNNYLIKQLEIESPDYCEFDESGKVKVTYIPAEMIIPAK